jgi:hypothetical protein
MSSSQLHQVKHGQHPSSKSTAERRTLDNHEHRGTAAPGGNKKSIKQMIEDGAILDSRECNGRHPLPNTVVTDRQKSAQKHVEHNVVTANRTAPATMEQQKRYIPDKQEDGATVLESEHFGNEASVTPTAQVGGFQNDKTRVASEPRLQKTYTSNSAAGTTKSPRVRPSLIEELFPERYNTSIARADSTHRDVPRLSLDLPSWRDRDISQTKTPPIRRIEKNGASLPAVLLLHGASSTLVEQDFRALVPKGTHIREWSNHSGSFLKVIPVRDPISLEQLPAYFLLFSTQRAAVEYHRRAHKVHKLVCYHSAKSYKDIMGPPPGLMQDGEDLNSVIKSYALGNPSEPLTLKYFSPPFDDTLTALFKDGGYWPIVNDNGTTKVLLTVHGPSMLSQSVILQAIKNDGFDRGQPWAISPLNPVSSLRELMLKRPSMKLDSTKSVVYSIPKEDQRNNYFDARTAMKWLISFTDITDAKRFASTWNGRALYGGTFAGSDAIEVPSVVHASVLW